MNVDGHGFQETSEEFLLHPGGGDPIWTSTGALSKTVLGLKVKSLKVVEQKKEHRGRCL